jgi:hypothetical protein
MRWWNMFSSLPTKDILLVLLGGLFGWMLGKMPITVVYWVIAVSIILVILVLR